MKGDLAQTTGLIAYWDGVSESIIMCCKDPSSPGSDVIIHLNDMVYDPELPDYLFEPPTGDYLLCIRGAVLYYFIIT